MEICKSENLSCSSATSFNISIFLVATIFFVISNYVGTSLFLTRKIKRPLIIVTEYALTFAGDFDRWILWS